MQFTLGLCLAGLAVAAPAPQLGALTGTLGGVTGGLGGATGALGGVTGALGGATGALGGATGALGGVTNGVTGGLGGATGALGGVTGAVGGLTNSATGAVGGATGALGGVTGTVTGAAGSVTTPGASSGETTPASDPDYKACTSLLSSNLNCCATDIEGLVDLDCAPPKKTPGSAKEFEQICASVGQQPRCCALTLLGQGVLCGKVVGL
ncbi:hypothetical protein VHEMI05384 [[Torrubiella] hemipterigena]|uniref:Hydrophobin n=1 Tax=[Torrubiella] hemipterigena TaxID=1531966 RepID=A0A0A1TGU9_9HYPO|nr:hypothetical protein VHEMI05384 [[Torrubiella] hemipterigena]